MQKCFEILERLSTEARKISEQKGIHSYEELIEQLYFQLKKEKAAKTQEIMDKTSPLAGKIAYLIGRMNRYARIYNKEALRQTQFSTMEEFSFCATLLTQSPMRKSELIHENMSEVPAGMSVIKRLVSRNFLSEMEDPLDKRAQLIRLTDTGKQAVFQAFEILKPVTKTIVADLDEEHQNLLINTLEHLDEYHWTSLKMR